MTAPAARIAWLDLVRAASIVLVVLYHVGAGAGYALLPKDSSSAGAWWSSVNLALAPVRMPLFFLVSGMLAVRAVQ
ncbi:MAG: acyltransferase family protein, partial [Actinomycetales bacterium]|nr:acyltransferase family protein [Actinomycetales bacterium]